MFAGAVAGRDEAYVAPLSAKFPVLGRKIPFETILPESLKNSVRYADLMISTDESQGFFPTHDGNGSINAGEYPAVAG